MGSEVSLPTDLAAATALVETLAVANSTYAAVAVQLYASVEASTEQLRRQLEAASGVGQLVNLVV